ncbi:MAG: hypothetical protein CVU12_01935 [Bacteroidetes bacterium HGW-Bacteroidetes-7]|jgi:hypothetical protein|nr:MAG: hypothetical protein CVU12_01935 [Bacteroidetes bacterium HGW-Bacteroidetes-7]
MSKALSVYQVISNKRKVVEFDGVWKDAIGDPELSGTWIIWGQSFNGKTTFVLQLCKYLCGYEKVLYNSLEEGAGRSMQLAFERVGMEEVARSFSLLEGESMPELIARLKKRHSPNIVIIDSVQYADITYKEYKKLKRLFPSKLFIFISHAEGKLPDGRVANKMRYDAHCKIRVEGYRAYINSRFSESKSEENYITVWEDGAKRYWGVNN